MVYACMAHIHSLKIGLLGKRGLKSAAHTKCKDVTNKNGSTLIVILTRLP